MTALDSLSSRQKAELLLEPNNLSNETLVRLAFKELNASSPMEDLDSFFDRFVNGAAEVTILTTFSLLILFTKIKNKLTNLCHSFLAKPDIH